jgi:FkbM family methyltransferase
LKVLVNFLIKALNIVFRLFGPEKAIVIASTVAERMIPVIGISTEYGKIDFYSLGGIPAWRAHTLLTKEPETIDWINKMDSNNILWDVGANVGVYSLYAAKKGLSVKSFEPSSANYFLLNKNIEINHLSDNISAFCLAFNDEILLDSLNMIRTEFGSAHSTFSDKVDQYGNSFTPVFKQGMIGFDIDGFIDQFSPKFPNHIKIDVDGIEDKIINGAKKTLNDKRLKSLLVELDLTRPEYCKEMIESIEKCGLIGGVCEGYEGTMSNAIFYRS